MRAWDKGIELPLQLDEEGRGDTMSHFEKRCMMILPQIRPPDL
jgi:hypothetical protein